MAPRSKAPPPPPDPSKLRREAAGRYRTVDDRFGVVQTSSGWMVEDAEQTNDLGLPLVRGPFATLDDARGAIEAARTGPAPVSSLADRLVTNRARAADRRGSLGAARGRRATGPAAANEVPAPPPPAAPPPPPPPLVVREYRTGDAPGLRELWSAAGFTSIGDDDRGLRTFAQRNPGLFLVALRGSDVVASVMGGWDGRRGWLYHVAVAEPERRAGLGTRLVREVESRLERLGCRKTNLIVRDGNADGLEFWQSLGYTISPARQLGRLLSDADADADIGTVNPAPPKGR